MADPFDRFKKVEKRFEKDIQGNSKKIDEIAKRRGLIPPDEKEKDEDTDNR